MSLPSRSETMVIVQLWEDPVLVYEAQLKERGVSSAESVETYANTLEKGLNNIVNQAKSSGIDLKVDAHYTHTFFGFSAGVPFSQIAKLEKLPGVKRVFPDLPVELPDITYTILRPVLRQCGNAGRLYRRGHYRCCY